MTMKCSGENVGMPGTRPSCRGRGVPYAQGGGVDQSDDISRERFVDDIAVATEDLLSVFRGEGFAGAGVGEHGSAFEDPEQTRM